MSAEDRQDASPPEPPDQKGEQPGPAADGQRAGEQQEMKTSPFPQPAMEHVDLAGDHTPPADDD